MFVGNMLHKRFPFGCDHLLEAVLGGFGTPVEIVAYSFYPVSYLLAALLCPAAAASFQLIEQCARCQSNGLNQAGFPLSTWQCPCGDRI